MRRNLLSVLLTLLVLLLIEGAPIAAQSDVTILDALPGCGFTEAYDDISGLQVGAVIYNFETGEGCVENLDTTFPVASVPKVFVSAAYQQMVVQGMLSPQQTIRFSEDYLMGGGGDCLNDGDLGRDISLRELNEIMITCSDNAATWMLMDLMGWDYVDYYVDSIGLTSVGPVVPYAEVDRAKLAIIDPLWSQVPAAFASRFMRRRQTEGLDTYFSTAPRFSGRQYREASQIYFDTYDYNTATPRDIARFFARLRDDYRNDFGANGQIAASVINTMLETQRQYSTQAFPGTVYVGSKNGFDTGLVAEVNFTLHSLAGFDRTPAAMAIIFTRQTNLLVENVQQPRQSEGVLNQLLRDLSPRIVDILYPDFTPPPVTPNWSLNTVHIGLPEAVNNCWSN
ncbi:MAG: serine hydrolase, partial [Phototrophicaceae bacterium]